MTTGRGPQHRVTVVVQNREGQIVATATCFFSTWSDEASGQARWRGFLAFIDPPGAVTVGPCRLRLPSGVEASIDVREHRSEGAREQACSSAKARRQRSLNAVTFVDRQAYP